ncbi:alpha/beta hydrolase [Cytobacillus kochii]
MKKWQWKEYNLSILLPENETPQLTIIVQDGSYLFEYFEQHPLKHIAFVGVDPIDRNREYTPWYAKVDDYAYEGEADTYLTMVKDELLPFLHKEFHLSIEPKHVGLAGASFGALVSLYSLLTRREDFDYYFLLSASLWYPDFLSFLQKQPAITDEKHIFWYVGEKEGDEYPNILRDMVPNTIEATKALDEKLVHPHASFQFITDAEGIHRHPYFEKYFRGFILEVEDRFEANITSHA